MRLVRETLAVSLRKAGDVNADNALVDYTSPTTQRNPCTAHAVPAFRRLPSGGEPDARTRAAAGLSLIFLR